MDSSSSVLAGVPAGTARFTLDREVGRADPRLFGSFVEHVGRSVYGGLYDPDDPSATAEGFRSDVLALVRELGVSLVRYPGGNFVSGYDWRDGVGPRERRPRRLDLAWHTIEPNTFGTDEFVAWCRACGVEPMLAVNLGLGGTRDALDLLEYANHPGGTALSDERVRHGAPDPHGVRLWCLGNEMDGPWQLGHLSAGDYARKAATAAAAMRMFDETLELVVVGSSNAHMPTFGAWEREVLAGTIDLVDFLSCHIYFYEGGDLAGFLRSASRLDVFLDEIAATIAEVRAATGSTRDVRISLDEWNVWDYPAEDAAKVGRQWQEAPRLLEQAYTAADAVVVGTLLQSILAHADVVAIAAMAQLVNAIGPIRAERGRPAWRQTTFHPFAAAARSSGHTVRTTTATAAGGAEASCVVTVAPDGDRVLVHLACTGTSVGAEVAVDLGPLGPLVVERGELVWHPDPHAVNDADHPDEVAPRPLPAEVVDDVLRLSLPPVSWASVSLVRPGADR